MAEVMDDTLTNLTEDLANKAGWNGEFRSSRTGRCFQDLMDEFAFIRDVEVRQLFSEILAGRITRDRDVLPNVYDDRDRYEDGSWAPVDRTAEYDVLPRQYIEDRTLYEHNIIEEDYNNYISYFFAYKSTLLFVHQKKYVETAIRAAVSLGATAAQTGVLLLTRNYIYYLLLAIGATIVQNAAISLQADRLYPYLREKNVRPLPPEILGEIRRNVRAMLLHRIGAVAVLNTDNLLISKFVGVAAAGLYSNYVMIRGFLNIMVGALFDVITPALGNLAATETVEGKQAAFRRLAFFSAWLFGWMSICLFCLYDPFIDLWLGEGYLLPAPAVLIVANFYVTCMRTPVINTKSVLGLFWEDRHKSIVEAAFNLAVTAAAGALTWLLCGLTGSGTAGFLKKGFIRAAAPNLAFWAAYGRTKEFLFLKGAAEQRIRRERQGRKLS